MSEVRTKPNSALHIEFDGAEGERFLITSEMYNPFVLKRIYTIDKGPNKGKERITTIGYYSDAKFLGKYLALDALTAGKTVHTVQELGKRIDDIADNFGEQLEKLAKLSKSSSGN